MLNLWWPRQMVDDVRDGATAKAAAGWLTRVWWTAWLASWATGRISSALYPGPDVRGRELVDRLHSAAIADGVHNVVKVIALVLALLVVRSTTRMVTASPLGAR